MQISSNYLAISDYPIQLIKTMSTQIHYLSDTYLNYNEQGSIDIHPRKKKHLLNEGQEFMEIESVLKNASW